MDERPLIFNSTQEFSISVVIATRNSPNVFYELIILLNNWLLSLEILYEIIVVDDASPRPLDINLIPSGVLIHNLSKQKGQNKALLYGIRKAQMNWIYTQDDDMLPDFTQLESWMQSAVMDSIPLSYGSFLSSPRTHWRHWPGQLVRGAYALFANQWKQPTSLRFFRRTLVSGIPEGNFPLFLESWLLAAASKVSFTPMAIKRFASPRSRYTLSNLVSLALMVLFLYTSLPFWIITGILFATCTFVYPAWLYSLLLAFLLVNGVLIRVWGCPIGIWAKRRL